MCASVRGAAYALPGPLERVVTSLTPASGTVLASTLPGNFRAVVDSPQASFSAPGEKRKGKTLRARREHLCAVDTCTNLH